MTQHRILPGDGDREMIIPKEVIEFCIKKGIPMKTEHVLTESERRQVWEAALLIAPHILNPDTSFTVVVKDVKEAFILLFSALDCKQPRK